MQPTADPSEMTIAQDPNHTPVEGELDFEEATDEALEAQAKWGAQQALLAAQERTKNFDESVKEHRESNIALNQSDRKCLIIIRQPGERVCEKQLIRCFPFVYVYARSRRDELPESIQYANYHRD